MLSGSSTMKIKNVVETKTEPRGITVWANDQEWMFRITFNIAFIRKTE